MVSDLDYFEKDGTPIKCRMCECKKLVDRNHSMLESIVAEYGVYCTQCGIRVNYWAYGHWEYIP